ncbi:hypothetical protein CK203_006642 [Vitis vinifera]|uniref:Ubiquitin-like protease family profile domain-containing protein n=1 Tax=Vitis vinifera TaxID=29760 RepID=A0A438KAN0_VITVI|nr:hypothetical protein CK203_006642 [Vitis vinifera]
MSCAGGSYLNMTLPTIGLKWQLAVLSMFNEQHVSQVMGIPNSGEDLVIVKRTGPSNRTYTLKVLEQNLDNLPVVIVEVTWPLATAWSDDVIKRCLAAEISTFGGYGHVDAQEQPQSTPHMQVPSVASTSTAGDDAYRARISETSETMLRLALSLVRDVGALRCRPGGSEGNSSVPCPSTELHTKDQPMRPTPMRQPSAEEIELEDSLVPTPHSPVGMGPSPAPTYSEPLVPQSQAEASLPAEVTVVIVEDAEEGEGVGGSGSQAPKPSSMKRYKRTAKRIVKRPPACKSPFVAQCVKQFPKIPHADRVVADYALAEMGDPSEILCDMYGMYIRREELSCLNAGRWVNSMQAPPARAHFCEPSFSVVLSNLKSNATTQVILERCAMYLDSDTLGHDLSSCDMMFIPVCENNHWHVHVVNFAAGRVEILSSLPLRRGNNISAATQRLSMALHKALHAYRIHMDVDVSSFVHVQPHLLQ